MEMAYALRNLQKLPPNNLMQFPSGRWGFVGSVDARLSIVQLDGSPATPDQIRKAASFGIGIMRHEIRTRSWETRADAIAAAAELGVMITA